MLHIACRKHNTRINNSRYFVSEAQRAAAGRGGGEEEEEVVIEGVEKDLQQAPYNGNRNANCATVAFEVDAWVLRWAEACGRWQAEENILCRKSSTQQAASTHTHTQQNVLKAWICRWFSLSLYVSVSGYSLLYTCGNVPGSSWRQMLHVVCGACFAFHRET